LTFRKRDAFELNMRAHARVAKTLVITDPGSSRAAEVADLVLPVKID